jgi:hypothetical protein
VDQRGVTVGHRLSFSVVPGLCCTTRSGVGLCTLHYSKKIKKKKGVWPPELLKGQMPRIKSYSGQASCPWFNEIIGSHPVNSYVGSPVLLQKEGSSSRVHDRTGDWVSFEAHEDQVMCLSTVPQRCDKVSPKQ